MMDPCEGNTDDENGKKSHFSVVEMMKSSLHCTKIRQCAHYKWQIIYPLLVMMLVWTASMSRPTARPWRIVHGKWSARFFASALSAYSSTENRPRIAVIGGGASGIFAAIAASENAAANRGPLVTVLEATSQTLQKVKISGGGRCNVLHDTSKSTTTLLSGYPRGQKELNGLFHKHFTPTMARQWFEGRGVQLKTEADGRMFPITDSSQTIMDTLMKAAERNGVEICRKHKVASIQQSGTRYLVECKDQTGQQEQYYDAVILATGSSPAGYALVKALEQPMDPTVPSLFTLNTKTETQEGGLLYGLSGVSVPTARVTLPLLPPSEDTSYGTKKQRNKSRNFPSQEGSLLITHHGLSGPAVLRLSAFAAHEFKAQNYRGPIRIHWDTASLGDNVDAVLDELWKITTSNPKRTVASACPVLNNSIPRRLWSALVLYSGFESDAVWGGAPKKLVRQLATNLVACELEVTGKGTFKDEFVTAGGVSLKSVDMKRMESKLHPGLFVCGELLNIDGVTGGFNFMNCWSTGYVAGHSAVEHCHEQQQLQEQQE